MDNKVLIIKSDSDSFERYYNKGFAKLCKLITYGEIYNTKTNRIQQLQEIRKTIVKKKRNGFFSQLDSIIIFGHFELMLEIVFFSGFKGRKILWLWNKVEDWQIKYLKILKGLCQIYTFDEGDAKKYDLKLNTQMYYAGKEIPDQISYQTEGKVFFVGKDKGRRKIIKQIELILEKSGIPYDINIVGEIKTDGKPFISMDYNTVIDHILSADTILEICQPGQEGITARTLEALFYRKKLITNNESIINLNFYNKNCIYVINQENIEGIPYFLKEGEDCNYNSCAVEYYSLEQWIYRFFE